MPEGKKEQNINPWMISTIVLAIVVVGIFIFGGKSLLSSFGGNVEAIGTQQGSDNLLKFLSEVYGDKVGTITPTGVIEENGLYKVTVTFAKDGQTSSGDLYITRDGKLFIPQIIDIEDTVSKFREANKPIDAAGDANVDASPEESPSAMDKEPSASPEKESSPSGSDTNTNSEGVAPVQE